MSRTLNLVDFLHFQAQQRQRLGLVPEALRIWKRLERLEDVPAEVAEDTQSQLADIRSQRGQYAKARKHLSAALAFQPDDERHHYRLATCLLAGADPKPEKALEHLRRCLEQDPVNPLYQAEFGLVCLRLEKREEGLAALRQAFFLAPDNPQVVKKVAEGMLQAGAEEEARNQLRAALFRNPRQAAFRNLWNQFQFQLLYDRQAASRKDSLSEPIDCLNLLPFTAGPSEPGSETSLPIRRDAPSRPAGPHRPFPVSRPKNQKQAR